MISKEDNILLMVREIAHKYFYSWADVEDAIQEGILKVLEVQATDPDVSVAYLSVCVQNRLLDILRRRAYESEARARYVLPVKRDDELAGEFYEALVAALCRALPGGLAAIFLDLALAREDVCKDGKVLYKLIAEKHGLSPRGLYRKIADLKDNVERMVKI